VASGKISLAMSIPIWTYKVNRWLQLGNSSALTSNGSDSSSKKLKKLPDSAGSSSGSASSSMTRGCNLVKALAGSFQEILVVCGYQNQSVHSIPSNEDHTEATISRSQEKSSMDSVIPSASGLSSAASGGGTYLNSFFRMESEKYGFSLKYCHVKF
jgi:hypothetical protein